MGKQDYEQKVPKEVKEKNSEKMTTLQGEVEELAKALDSIKLMLTEQ